jgi:hypothetical protein
MAEREATDYGKRLREEATDFRLQTTGSYSDGLTADSLFLENGPAASAVVKTNLKSGA